VFLSDGSSKTPNTAKKKINKKIDQKKPDFFSLFLSQAFGRFSVRGVQKHEKKYRGKKSDPGPFLASDPPTHHGGHRFFLADSLCLCLCG
jgi:hypothetical protein